MNKTELILGSLCVIVSTISLFSISTILTNANVKDEIIKKVIVRGSFLTVIIAILCLYIIYID